MSKRQIGSVERMLSNRPEKKAKSIESDGTKLLHPGVLPYVAQFLEPDEITAMAKVNRNARMGVLESYQDPWDIKDMIHGLEDTGKLISSEMKHVIRNDYKEIKFDDEEHIRSHGLDYIDMEYTLTMLHYYFEHNTLPMCKSVCELPSFVAVLQLIIKIPSEMRSQFLRSLFSNDSTTTFGKFMCVISRAYDTNYNRRVRNMHWLYSYKKACLYLSDRHFNTVIAELEYLNYCRRMYSNTHQ